MAFRRCDFYYNLKHVYVVTIKRTVASPLPQHESNLANLTLRIQYIVKRRYHPIPSNMSLLRMLFVWNYIFIWKWRKPETNKRQQRTIPDQLASRIFVGNLGVEWYNAVPNTKERKGNVLFNDALNTCYLGLYGVGHMVKDHSDSKRGYPLPPHGIHFPIRSKGSFICNIP